MLQTVREYAAEKLAERREVDQIREAHAQYYLAALRTKRDFEAWISLVDEDIDNIRAAVVFALNHGPEEALAAVVLLFDYWLARGVYAEAAGLLEEAVARTRASPLRLRLPALSRLAELQRLIGNMDRAGALADEAVQLARRNGEPGPLAHALATAASLALFRNQAESASLALEEGLPLARQAGEAVVLSELLQFQGVLALGEGELGEAEEALRRAWTIQRQDAKHGDAPSWLGGYWLAGYFLAGLGVLRGDVRDARAILDQALDTARTAAAPRFVRAHIEEMLGRALILEGNLDRAQASFEAAGVVHLETGAKICPAHLLEGCARLALAGAEPRRAARLLAAACSVQDALKLTLLPVERLLLEQTSDRAQAALDPASWQAAWDEGWLMSPEEALASAQAERLAQVSRG